MGRSNIPASGRVFKHSMIFLGKQTPHVHTARWVWWPTWVLYISSAWIPLSYVYISQISRQDTPKQRKLDSLQSKSKGATNETPTCVVPMHAPQTKSLCRGVGELKRGRWTAFVKCGVSGGYWVQPRLISGEEKTKTIMCTVPRLWI